ncbi:DUF3800 domain-containing protein [Alkalibacillus haloalkaliphilus]|uniref:DUF3800 domain-containing protein n=1 Tax=Alkalibacillus haloalkaliphilus TaxID=94136 RepID=UPI0002E7EE34|nr:DUF3800 domain-containing protein [Alkalibacillus haloalkaliphilus]
MGVLYLDEAGNTGLNDSQQKLLIYGGPYVDVPKWKAATNDLKGLKTKYLGIIASRFQSGFEPGMNVTDFLAELGQVEFLQNFHFHAKNIINRSGLWSKLTNEERFIVLEEILDVVIKSDIPFYFGVLDKESYSQNPDHPKGKMDEYRFLHEEFLTFLESDINEHDQVVTVIDDGDDGEKSALKECLNNSTRSKFYGELICGKHNEFPLLQVADAGIWIFQAYNRLSPDRVDPYANRVRDLYEKMKVVSRIHTC